MDSETLCSEILRLDGDRAPDEHYAHLLSSMSRNRRRGETWRDRALFALGLKYYGERRNGP